MAPVEGPTSGAGSDYSCPPCGNDLQLQFVTVEPPAGRSFADVPDPFVSLEDRGRFSRTLCARVIGPAGHSVRELALKVQSDEYPVAELPNWSNRDIEEQWRRQWHLWNIAAAAGVASEVLDVLPSAPDGGPPHLPPILYCKQRRAYFVAPCPQCAHPLQTCRDDELLDQYGLPAFQRSLERFLYCAACRVAGRPVQFYTLLLADRSLSHRAPVGEQTDLYRALAHLARSNGPLPCSGCEHVPTCYPEDDPRRGDVDHLLTPLSFYDFRCLPLARSPRHYYYDDFTALLGGRRIDESDGAVGGGLLERRYFFDDDPQGKLPLEILRLKLCLFSQLVTAVSGLHRATQLPHLGLSSENVIVEIADRVAGVPWLYNSRLRLGDIGSATRRFVKGLDPEDLSVPLLDPPPLRDTVYAAPLSTQPAAVRHEGALSVISVNRTPEGGAIVEVEIASESLNAVPLSPIDVVEVQIRQGRPLPLAIELFTTPLPATAEGIRLRSLPLAATTTGLAQLSSLAGQAQVRATAVVHRCLHVPCDVQSLGLMLFATLVANTEQGPGTVTAAARRISAAVERFVRENPDATAEDVDDYAVGVLRQGEKDGVLSQRHVFDDPSPRADHRSPIPDALWYGTLLLGLRALTQTAKFGFCRAHDDFDPEHPEGPSDHLRADLDVMSRKIDAELFATAGKQLVFKEAVMRVRAERERRAAPNGRGRIER